MIEERIIEWLDLGDSVQKVDIYERPKLLSFFKYHHLLIKHGISSEITDIIFILIFFIQIINLAAINLEPENDLILKVVKYLEIIILPHNNLFQEKKFIFLSCVTWVLNCIHIILTAIAFFLQYKKTVVKVLYLFISSINYIIYYYLIGPIVYLALYGTFCPNNIHDILKVECYSNSKHLSFTLLNFIFALYSLYIIETFSLYYNQTGIIHGSDVKTRLSCDYDIFSSNAKLVVYIIVYFYKEYAKDSEVFKYIYQVYIFMSCFFLSLYTMKKVFYYNRMINTLIHYCWFFDTWFALCMLLKICFKINDTTMVVLFGWILIIIIFTNHNAYSRYKIISQFDLFNEQNLVCIEKFNYELFNLYISNIKDDKMLLLGIIKKFEDYVGTNPELKDIYNKLTNDPFLIKKLVKLNELPMLSIIYTIYIYYLEKSEMKNEIIFHMCYYLINKINNATFAIYLISKLKVNSHSQLYHKFILMEEIKEFLINKLLKNNLQDSIDNVQIGSVILYYQYMDLFKVKIYDGTSNQIEYFETLRNNVTTGKITENFLKIGEDILKLKNEIFQLYNKIIELNPFSNESENDYMLYLKTILQDDILAKNEEKKFNLLKSNKFSEKNNIYYSMFKNDINSILLIDGYTSNGKILYATPNFPFLYKFNGKEIINTQIDDLLPNVVQSFHKDLIENSLRYSNLTDIFINAVDIFLKGKNNSLYNINLYIKPVPNLSYGLIFYALLSKILEHEFIILLDKDFKIDGYTEMNQGNSFTLNSNHNNNYYLSLNSINHHIGIIIPEILLQICYKDNSFFFSKNNIDIKGNLYSISNLKELDQKVNILLEIIKRKGFLNIDEETEEGKKILHEYNEFKKHLKSRQSKCYSIFYKIITKKFFNGRYRYYRLYITNDPLFLNDNLFLEKTLNISESEEYIDKQKNIKHTTFGLKNEEIEENVAIKKKESNSIEKSNKNVNFNTKPNPKETKKVIKLKVPVNKLIKSSNLIKEENKQDNQNNINDKGENNINENRVTRTNTLREQLNIDSAGFNKLKNGIVNKKDSIQIIFMKYVSLIFVIITVFLVVYDYSSSNKLYLELVQYLQENLIFTHSKIITSCIYISSINIKWLKYKYIDEDSCPQTCTTFYIKILEKCINNLKNGKDSFYKYDMDFQEIVLKRRKIVLDIFNTDKTQELYFPVNDNLNFIISKGIKVIGSFVNYLNYYGLYKINMENLIHQSYDYFISNIEGLTGEEKLSRVNKRFKNNYLTIIIGTILCFILLGIFSYFIFDFNQLEIFFLDKLINFNSQNFENYLKVLEDLKKKLKNYKNEEEENNLDDIDIEMNSKDEELESKKNNSKKKVEKKNAAKIKDAEEQDYKKVNKKRGNKQSKIQQQRIKKKKIMSFYFYKENILFAVKTSLILICFVSFFVVSFLVYKANLKSYLKFDTATNDIEDLYYESFRIFLIFKSELERYQLTNNYTSALPSGKDISIPNFGNILNDLSQNDIYGNRNKEILSQLYNGNLCLLLFKNIQTIDYQTCREFLSSILLKGMEQAIIQMGVMVNSVIDELTLINDEFEFNNTIYGNTTNFKKYEFFIEYYLLLSYLKNEEIFNNFRDDEIHHYSSLTTKIIIIFLVVYLALFILLCYIIFSYKYIYNSMFNFIAILSIKFISDDEYLYKKIIDLEKKLYK